MAFELVEQTPGWDGYWFDFYSAVTLDPYDYDIAWTSGYLRLSPYGCKVGQGWDCTAACLNTTTGPAMVWGNADLFSMYTLSNCVMLPVIAALLAGGNLTASGVEVAKKFNIPANSSLLETPSTAWPVINNCIEAYCQSGDSPTPGCTPHNPDTYTQYAFLPNDSYYVNEQKYDTVTNAYWWPVNYTISGKKVFNSGLCYNLNADINPDIGGIGMFASYMMQTFIVLSAWLAFHFYRSWAVWPIMLTLVPFHGPRRASTLARDLQTKISSYTDALVAALVEFQKAQIFFMLSVQIAIIVALHDPLYIQADSWQELWNNFGILFSLAFGGCLPVLFVMLMLRIAGKKGFYTLILSLCSVGLSGATWFIAWNSFPNPNTSVTAPQPPVLAECANVAPIKYCYGSAVYTNSDEIYSRAVPMLVWCFVVQSCFMLDNVNCFVIRGPSGETRKGSVFDWIQYKILQLSFWKRYDEKAGMRSRYMRIFRLDTSARIMQVVSRFILVAAECTFVALNMVLISDYAHLLSPGNDYQTLNTKEWSLGQIISVTIWVPVLIEYVWQAIVGVEEGQKFRLPPGYRLIKEDETPVDEQAQVEVLDAPSSAVDLAPLKPVGRPGYERVDSNNW